VKKAQLIYATVFAQLNYHKVVDDKKIKSIVRSSFEYSGVECTDYYIFIYLDFLESIGLIEYLSTNYNRKWQFNSTEFSHTVNGRIYSINNLDSDGEFQLFKCSNDEVFPLLSQTKMKQALTDKYIKKIIELDINYKNHKEDYVKDVGISINKFRFVELYDPIFSKWTQVDKCELQGLYRVGNRVYEKSFYLKLNNKFFHIIDNEWAFVIAQDLGKENLINARYLTKEEFLIPWRFKLPSLIKRILVSSSKGIIYTEKGINYNLQDFENLQKALGKFNVFGKIA